MMARLADCKDFLQTINIVSQFFIVLLLGPSHLSSTRALLLHEHKGSRWQGCFDTLCARAQKVQNKC